MRYLYVLAIVFVSLCAVNSAHAQNTLSILDTRNVSTDPGTYSQQMALNFKFSDSIGLASSRAGNYSTLLSFHGWKDFTGGPTHEIALSTYGDIFSRIGGSAGWQGWRRMLMEDANGNVGIGTNLPGYRLQVFDTVAEVYTITGTSAVPAGNVIGVTNAAPTDGSSATLSFIARNAAGYNNLGYVGIISHPGTTFSSSMVFGLRYGTGGYAESMRIAPGGKVGIGTSAPAKRFEVYDSISTAVYMTDSATAAMPSGIVTTFSNMGHINGNSGGIALAAGNATGQHALAYICAVSLPGNPAAETAFGRRIENVSNGGQSYRETMRLTADGNVGIGTKTPGSYKLAVEGIIGARKVKVTTTSWADFVFDENYKRPSLEETEAYIKANKHLPDVPSAAEVTKDGQDLGEMNRILLQKVEELTLELIEMKKELNAIKAQQAASK